MPAIASNITTPLLGLIDVAIVGHIGSAVYIAAIALGGAVINMLYWIFGFLRLGSSGITAQAFGAGDLSAQRAVFFRGLVIALALAALILALRRPAADAILSFMDAAPDASSAAGRYVAICIWGAPAVLATNALSGWMLGMQYSRGPMWMALVTNIVNICASLVFVFVLHLDIAGVALGTCLAQWTGLAAGLLLVSRRFSTGRPDWRRVFRASEIRRFFSINFDIFLRTLCLVAVTLWFTHAGAVQGTLVLAANALLMQFFMLFSYFTDGFAFAGEALSGKYRGAGDPRTLARCIRSLFRIGALLSLVFTAIYFVAGDLIMQTLTSDTSVISTASDYFFWILTVPLAGFMAFTWDGIFGGLTLTRAGLLLPMIISAAVFFSFYFLLAPRWGNHGLWAAFIIYCATRGIAQSIFYRIYKKRIFAK